MALLINDVVRAPVCDFEPAGAVQTGVGTLNTAVPESRLDVLVSFGIGQGRFEDRRPRLHGVGMEQLLPCRTACGQNSTWSFNKHTHSLQHKL